MNISGIFPPDVLLCAASDAADGAPATVERDADGVPMAWRLLRRGSNPLVKDGSPGSLELGEDECRDGPANRSLLGRLMTFSPTRSSISRTAAIRFLLQPCLILLFYRFGKEESCRIGMKDWG